MLRIFLGQFPIFIWWDICWNIQLIIKSWVVLLLSHNSSVYSRYVIKYLFCKYFLPAWIFPFLCSWYSMFWSTEVWINSKIILSFTFTSFSVLRNLYLIQVHKDIFCLWLAYKFYSFRFYIVYDKSKTNFCVWSILTF